MRPGLTRDSRRARGAEAAWSRGAATVLRGLGRIPTFASVGGGGAGGAAWGGGRGGIREREPDARAALRVGRLREHRQSPPSPRARGGVRALGDLDGSRDRDGGGDRRGAATAAGNPAPRSDQ